VAVVGRKREEMSDGRGVELKRKRGRRKGPQDFGGCER
jgi:hypothetical protein